jgi:glutaredoxin 3
MTVEIYTSPGCINCTLAKDLLFDHGMPYNERVLGTDFAREFIVEHFPGRTTYPIIVVDGMTVGGYNNLKTYLNLNEQHDNRKFLVE